MLEKITPLECAQVIYDWTLWARPDQAPPPDDWIVWLILAGRGAGKTRAGAEAIREWSKTHAIVNLIGPTADDVRDVMVNGRAVVRDGKILTMDEGAILAKAEEYRVKVSASLKK